MTNPALQVLLERLLWPVPRIRAEAGRALAGLIREGDEEANHALLGWISCRTLESEVVLGLGIIDAFDLGKYFEFDEVSESIRSPSILSDWILKRNFKAAKGLSPFRYDTSRPEQAVLPRNVGLWFERFRETAVPPIFSKMLAHLERLSHFPMWSRWEHEWRWLQKTNPRPAEGGADFFLRGDLRRIRPLHQGQRELYVSAYLRTLAYATNIGAIPLDVAEYFSLAALPMTRGLADLVPVERPEWTMNLLSCKPGDTKRFAQELLSNSRVAARPGEEPAALRAIDVGEEGFSEFVLTLVVGPSGFTDGPAKCEILDYVYVREHPGNMAGLVNSDATMLDVRSCGLPLPICQTFVPEPPGSIHVELSLETRLASPHLFGKYVRLECKPAEIRLSLGSDVLSRWVYWYTDWAPATLDDLDSYVGSLSTVSEASLESLLKAGGLETSWLVQVRLAKKPRSYVKPDIYEESFWM